MESYTLSSHVRACEVDDGAVFLDLRNARYFGLGLAQLGALRRFVEGWPIRAQTRLPTQGTTLSDHELLHHLAARGLVVRPSSRPLRTAQELPMPARALRLERRSIPDTRTRARTVSRFARSLVITAVNLRLYTLEEIFDRFTQRGSLLERTEGAREERMRELVLVFRRLRLWTYTATGHCLFDSLALGMFLQLHALRPTLLMGVRAKPFAAHCWLQDADCVLNDTLDHVEEFTPLLAVR